MTPTIFNTLVQNYNLYATQSRVQSNGLTIQNNKMSLMYNTGRGIEFGFDSTNTSYIDFHSYDSLNVDYDCRIICGGSYGNGNVGGGSMSIKALNLNWNNESIATQNFVNTNYMTLTGGTFTGLIKFSTGIPLNTTYAGCR